MNILKNIATGLAGLGTGLFTAIVGNEALQSKAAGATNKFIDKLSSTREDDRIYAVVLCGLDGVFEDVKVLLKDVYADIERDYRKFVKRQEGTERELLQARDAKKKKDGARMTIGGSPKDEKSQRYLEGELAAYTLFEGVANDNSQTDKEKKAILKKNLLTLGTNCQELGKIKILTEKTGDLWRDWKRSSVAMTTSIYNTITSQPVKRAGTIVLKETSTGIIGISSGLKLISIVVLMFIVLTLLTLFLVW